MKLAIILALILGIFAIVPEAFGSCTRDYQCRTGKCIKTTSFFCGIGSMSFKILPIYGIDYVN